MKGCAIYVRVSSKDQVEGASLDDQERVCREFAERLGYSVHRVYREAGASAWKDDLKNRPQLSSLLNEIRLRSIQYVIVYKLDRLARKARLYHNVAYQLEFNQVQLLSATEPNDPSAAGRLSSGMLAQFAEFYSAQLSERLRSAQAGKARRGDWVGDVPFGYERDGKTLKPSPLAKWVVWMFEGYIEGKNSVDLSVELNALGIQTRVGKRFTKEAVLGILHNPSYLGLISHRKERSKGNHPALISVEQFEQVQAMLAKYQRKPLGRKRLSHERNYTVYCALCGSVMRRHPSAKIVYFRCVQALNGECEARGVSLDRVEKQVTALREGGVDLATIWIKFPKGIERFT